MLACGKCCREKIKAGKEDGVEFLKEWLGKASLRMKVNFQKNPEASDAASHVDV